MTKVLRVMAVLLATACLGGPTEISLESAAIGAALAKGAVLSGRVGGYNAFALSQLDKTKKLTLVTDASGATAEFEAAAVLIVWDFSATQGQFETGFYNGVVAWRGVDLATQTVENMSTAGAAGSGTASFSTITAQMDQATGNTIGEAVVYVKSTESLYAATTGTYTATSASFGSPRACARPTDAPPPPIQCVVSTGTIRGSFNFGATRVSGSGGTTVTQPNVTFDLPAIQVIISG